MLLFCSRQWLTQRTTPRLHQLTTIQRIRDQGRFCLNWHMYVTCMSLREEVSLNFRVHWRRRGGKVLKAEGGGWLQEESNLWAQQGRCTYKLTVACSSDSTQPAQTQARQNPSRGRGSGQEIPPLAEELLASDCCWKWRVSFLPFP